MSAPYSYPNGTVDFIGVVSYINDSLGNDIFGMGIVFTIFVLMLMAIGSKTNNILEAGAISSFVTGIIAVLMTYLGWVSGKFALLFMFITAVTLAFIYYKY